MPRYNVRRHLESRARRPRVRDAFPQLIDALAEKERAFDVASGGGDFALAQRIWFDAAAIRSELRPARMQG
jgi:hypothetical protein